MTSVPANKQPIDGGAWAKKLLTFSKRVAVRQVTAIASAPERLTVPLCPQLVPQGGHVCDIFSDGSHYEAWTTPAKVWTVIYPDYLERAKEKVESARRLLKKSPSLPGPAVRRGGIPEQHRVLSGNH